MKNYTYQNDGKEIRIDRMDPPYPWVNYLTNTKLSAMISQAGGGFLWYKSPQKLRITRYRYHQLPADTPGFYLYIKEENGSVWCPTFQPMRDTETERYTLHRPGETCFVANHGNTEAILTFFIPPNMNTLIWELKLTNHSQKDKNYQIYAYTEFSQLDWTQEQNFGYYWQHMLRTKFDQTNQFLMYSFHFLKEGFYQNTSPLIYLASDRTVRSFCGDRDTFIGNYRDESHPIQLEAGSCGNEEIFSGNPCGVLQVECKIPSEAQETVHFFLGLEEGAMIDFDKTYQTVCKSLKQLRTSGTVEQLKQELKKRYTAHFAHFQCDLPDQELQRHINIWGPLNAMQFSLFHQTPQPSAPGVRGIGARDKLQALMPMVFRNPEKVRNSFLFLLSLQYENGAISHNIGGYMDEFGKIGAYNRQTIKSDDHLWFPFLAYAIAAETDVSFLNEKIPYSTVDGKPTTESDTVWNHLMRAISFTQQNLGSHGLPLMLDGDWNDIINRFSKAGKGESVFAGQQYVAALKKMIELAEYTKKETDILTLKAYLEEQEKNLLTHAWNGQWWYRCFDDAGIPIGCENDRFGKIWLNPQSWAIIAGVGSDAQKSSALHAAETCLDTGYGLQLLAPGFQTYPEEKNPFSPYNPGTGENGAIFCHAHTWAIIAEAILGNAEKAWKYYTDLLPFVLNERLGTEVYRSDPFGWVSNIVGPENPKHGWGNVIRFTGTCSWMNIAATQYLLGIRTRLNGILIDPCIPPDWTHFHVQRDYLNCRLDITFHNPNHASKGVKRIRINGAPMSGNFIPRSLILGKQSVKIEAEL